MRFRVAQSARKHRIGRAHALYVIDNNDQEYEEAEGDLDPRYIWSDPDSTGRMLEVIAARIADDTIHVSHVMPNYRPKEQR